MGGRTAGVRRQARRRTYREWQRRWDANTGKAEWTKRLVGSIEDWMECGHKHTCYYFTQFMTGHGSYGTFTKKIGETQSDVCIVCNRTDSPEHMLRECRRWEVERTELGEVPEVEDLIGKMIRDETEWNKYYKFIVGVMRKKEKEDRDREQREREE